MQTPGSVLQPTSVPSSNALSTR